MNSISITGRVTKDVAIKYLDSGKAVANISLADSRREGDEEITLFYDVSVWGNRAEVAAEYIKKGGLVSVVGRLDPPRVHDSKAYLKVTAYDFTLPPRNTGEPPASPKHTPTVNAPSRIVSRPTAPAVDDGIPF